VVVTFGPDGMTSHHDHITAGAAATEAFHRAREGAPDGSFLRLYHTAHRRADIDRFYAGIEGLAPEFGGPGVLFNPVGVPDETIAVEVDTGPVHDIKLAGILRHGTQVGELERIPEQLRWIYLSKECFVQAWPPSDPSEGVRTDLFEGIDS
jgi:LmbE family N-acetylglucosaminyl deacetylase